MKFGAKPGWLTGITGSDPVTTGRCVLHKGPFTQRDWAKTSILRKVAGGNLTAVETFTKTGQSTMYEAAYTDKKGKKHEVLVKADSY